MKKWLEIIKLLPKALSNPEEVIEGWVNDIKFRKGTLDEEFVKEILRRRAICESCPNNSKNAVQDGWYKTERTDDHCTFCSCPIEKKTASLESNCGIAYYNEQNPKNQLPLKWEAYKKSEENGK